MSLKFCLKFIEIVLLVSLGDAHRIAFFTMLDGKSHALSMMPLALRFAFFASKIFSAWPTAATASPSPIM